MTMEFDPFRAKHGSTAIYAILLNLKPTNNTGDMDHRKSAE